MLGALIFVASASPTFTQTYHLTDLGALTPQGGEPISHPGGINNAGQVAGQSYSSNQLHAVRFYYGAIDDLGTIPGGSTSTGVAINDLGHVTGDSQYSVNGGAIRHAALWYNGTVTDLGFLPAGKLLARQRHQQLRRRRRTFGAVSSLSTSNTRAFIWDAANGMRDLGTLGGAYAKAFGINNSNVVTGTSQSNTGGFHAFIWDTANGMRDIGTIAGNTSSGAFINDNGHIAGTSTINGFDNCEHAFLYDGATMRDLGAVGNNDFFTDRSTAYGVNIHDVVVGSTFIDPMVVGQLSGSHSSIATARCSTSNLWSMRRVPAIASMPPPESTTPDRSRLTRSESATPNQIRARSPDAEPGTRPGRLAQNARSGRRL